MNWDKVDELYNLDAEPIIEQLSLRAFVNQVVHSYIFLPIISRGGSLQGFFLASDRQRSSGLLHVDLDRVLEVRQAVARDEVTLQRTEFDASYGDWRILESRDLNYAQKGEWLGRVGGRG